MTQNRRRFQFALLAVAVAASLISASLLVAKPGDKAKRQKKSTESAGLKILHLTGTPKERGMTHGRRFAREIIRLIDAFIKAEKLSGGPDRYEATLGRVGRTMTIPPVYMEEMEGIFEGVNSKTGGKMLIPSIKRNLKLEDIVAMNAIADSVGFGCSSFGAWGPLTKNGDTIVARNLDWHYLPDMAKHQIIIVQTPDEENSRAGWAGISWPGQIGCYTGMNADGVTVCMHDVYTGPPDQQSGFTPRSLILREAIEKAHAATADRDILDVLKNHTVAVGNNIPVGVPFTDSAKSPPFMVFEYDGRKSLGGGVALRRAENMKKAGNSLVNGPGGCIFQVL
ncbi:MAG: hypothetical protein IPK83_07030 [Planctomycetes bacterium]|nr:hypothetical protein [Planctomycetota bacterium]